MLKTIFILLLSITLKFDEVTPETPEVKTGEEQTPEQ